MSAAPPVLEMRGISKSFPGVKALVNVGLTALAGEVHALMGENGAGKSTLIKIMSGAYAADPGGEIRIDGSPEAEEALKGDTMFVGTAAQSPFNVGAQSVKAGYELFQAKKPEKDLILIAPTLVTRDNIGQYKGWKAN